MGTETCMACFCAVADLGMEGRVCPQLVQPYEIHVIGSGVETCMACFCTVVDQGGGILGCHRTPFSVEVLSPALAIFFCYKSSDVMFWYLHAAHNDL